MDIVDVAGSGLDESAPARISELLLAAKSAIDVGESQMKIAAENIAAAIGAGATQRMVAATIEKSPSFVNRLLKWREDGYQDETPFGPQSKLSRERRRATVQATEQLVSAKDSDEVTVERARAETAKAEATKARADAARAKAEAAKVRDEYRAARAYARAKAYEDISPDFFENQAPKPDALSRNKLVKLLGMLGSDYPTERNNAATLIENLRKEINLTWDELIVPAAVDADAKAA
jgi:hypothetical protein